jgi:hypothetical protein
MNRIDIQGEKFNLYNTWEDVTLERFQRLCALKIPEKYENFVRSIFSDKPGDYDKATLETSDREWLKIFPAYYGDVILILSDIPPEVINNLHRIIREQLYEEYFYPFVVSVITGYSWYKDNGVLARSPRLNCKSFDFEGEKYFFPESLVYNQVEIPMCKESILTFSEASDIEIAITEWGQKGIDSVAQMIAVYCRKEGEEYNSDAVLERIAKFKNLPMTIIWEVFFYIAELGLKSVLVMLLYSQGLVNRIQEVQQTNQELQVIKQEG